MAARRPGVTAALVVVGVVALVVVVTGVIVVLVRHHDSSSSSGPDATYLATVQPEFPDVTSTALVSLGHTICLTFARHPDDPVAAEYDIATAASKYPKVPVADLVSLMHAAVGAYCPRVAPIIDSLSASTTTTAP